MFDFLMANDKAVRSCQPKKHGPWPLRVNEQTACGSRGKLGVQSRAGLVTV